MNKISIFLFLITILSHFYQIKVSEHRLDSDIAIFAWRVTWNYTDSPYKVEVTDKIEQVSWDLNFQPIST